MGLVPSELPHWQRLDAFTRSVADHVAEREEFGEYTSHDAAMAAILVLCTHLDIAQEYLSVIGVRVTLSEYNLTPDWNQRNEHLN